LLICSTDRVSVGKATEGKDAISGPIGLLLIVLTAILAAVLVLASVAPVHPASAVQAGVGVVLHATDAPAPSAASTDAITVKCSPSSISLGSSTQCTATVSGNSPGGSIRWTSDVMGTFSSSSCTLLSGACHVSYTPSSASSPVTISASYGGDANNAPVSGSFTLAVAAAHTTTTVTCSPATVTIGGNTTCTATVKGQGPTGVISWASNSGGTFQPTVCILTSGSCSALYLQSSVSTATITGVYSGDSNNQGSSDTFVLTIAKAATKTSVVCTPSSIFVGFSTSCLAAVRGYSPTGTATFSLSGGLGTFSPANGQCSLSLGNCSVSFKSNSTGTITIASAYGGDANNRASSGKFTLHSIEAVIYVLDPLDPLVSNTCSNLGGTWTGPQTCTLVGSPTFGSSDYVLVRPGAVMEVSGGAMLSDSGIINVTGGTLANDGFINVAASGKLVNSLYRGVCGTISNAGTITNSGTLTTSCSLTNIDLIKNQGSAVIDALGGSIINKGTISNAAGGSIIDDSGVQGVINNSGTISNSGLLDLFGGGNISVSGSSDFTGSFINTGTLGLNAGGSMVIGSGTTATILEFRGGSFAIGNGVTLSVSAGSEVVVDAGAALNSQGQLTTQTGSIGSGGVIFNGGTISDGATSLLLNNAGCSILNVAGSAFLNNGTVTNRGTISNSGTIANGKSGAFSNGGTLVNKGSIVNSGSLSNNAGVITNNAGGVVTNRPGGTITNNAYGTIDNNSGGTIANAGAFATAGTVINDAGGIINNLAGGTINNKAGGNFYNNPSGFVSNGGTITNSGAMTSNGEVSNLGVLTNSGDITNSGELTNSATITNTGAITSNGEISNGGTIANMGSITSSGTFTISSVGSVTNGGSVINSGRINSNGTFINNSAGRITIRGPLLNQGVFENCGGYLEGTFALAGNGAVSCAAAQAGQAPVSSGTVPTQLFTATGISVAITGANGSMVGISTASERGQPPGVGAVSLQPMGSTAPLYFDIGLFGVAGGSVHVCIFNPAVDSRTVIEYYSLGVWEQATGIGGKPGTDVCGDIPTSGLGGSPVVVGDTSGPIVTSTTVSSSGPSTTSSTSAASSSTSTGSNETTSEGPSTASASNSTSAGTPTASEAGPGGGGIPELPYQAPALAAAAILIAASYLVMRGRRPKHAESSGN